MTKTKNILNWVLGLVISALGLCLSTKSGLGLSMIGACPYILHKWLIDKYSWFTQGTAEYVFEALVLLVTCLAVRKFKPRFLLSFLTAVIVGYIIDGWLWLLGGNGIYASMPARVLSFAGGMVVTALGVAFFFRTSLPLEVYELTVNEIHKKYGFSLKNTKLAFDGCMLLTAIVMALLLTHKLTGIGWGTVIITLCNSFIITFFGKIIDKIEGLN